MKILKARNKDIKRIVNIHKKCVSKTNASFYNSKEIKEWLKQISTKNTVSQFNNTLWYILISKNRLVGFCQFSLDKNELYQINIDPIFQGTKLGQRLYKFVEQKFTGKNKKNILLNSTLNAVSFYKKLGFKPLKKMRFKLNKQRIEMVRMKKTLKL